MKKTSYEYLFEEIDAIKEELKTFTPKSEEERRVVSAVDIERTPLFVVEPLPEIAEKKIPLEKELFPFNEFWLELVGEGAAILVRVELNTNNLYQEGIDFFLSIANMQIGDFYPYAVRAGFDKYSKLVNLYYVKASDEAKIREHEQILFSQFSYVFFELYKFLLFLRSPVIYTSEIPIPKKRRAKLSEGQNPFTSYSKISVKKEYKRLYGMSEKKIVSEKEETSEDKKKRLHLCRAHFRNYTEDKPLFGKVTGPVFVRSHERGDGQFGVVLKSYTVKPLAK